MADYNPILDAETDPEAGLRSSLFKRMVANPIAIAEGAAGAPRIAARAMDGSDAFLAYLTITYNNYGAVTGLADVSVIRGFSLTSGSVGITRVAYSTDNGASWSSDTNTSIGTGGKFFLNLDTGAWRSMSSSGTLPFPAGVNAVRFGQFTASGTLNLYMEVGGGRA